MKKKLKNLFLITIISVFCLFGATNLNVKASTSNLEFNEFEVGMIFPIGYEMNLTNSNGVIPTKSYYFQPVDNVDLLFEVFLDTDGFYYYLNDELYLSSSENVFLGYDDNLNPIENITQLELINIVESNGVGELGNYSEVEPIEPNENYIYKGVYELLGNLIYGSTENLDDVAIGNLTFISTLITILCVISPFVILFFIIKKICD